MDVVEGGDCLNQEGADVEGFGAFYDFAGVHGAEDYDGDGGEAVVGVEDFEEFVAVHFWEGEIEEEDVWGFVDGVDESFAAGGGDVDVVAGEGEHAGDRFTRVGMVLDVQHSSHIRTIAQSWDFRQ